MTPCPNSDPTHPSHRWLPGNDVSWELRAEGVLQYSSRLLESEKSRLRFSFTKTYGNSFDFLKPFSSSEHGDGKRNGFHEQ
jgi:hypothetical protein